MSGTARSGNSGRSLGHDPLEGRTVCTSSNTPPERSRIFIVEAVDDLNAYLEMWANRRPLPEPDPAARAAVDQAVERIDDAIRRLVVLRSELVAEIRAVDRAFLALDDETPEG